MTDDNHTEAYRRYQTDDNYDLDDAIRDGMTDDEYVSIVDPYGEDDEYPNGWG